MNAAKLNATIATVAGALIFAVLPIASAAETSSPAPTKIAACESLGHRQTQDLKLAAKAQEGVRAFVQYAELQKPIQQWTIEQALARAQSAATTPCAVAMGMKPIENTKFATALVANSR